MGRTAGSFAAFASGVFAANSLPHLLTAFRGRRMLTPLAGKDSGPGANAAWGTMNAIASAGLAVAATRSPGTRMQRVGLFAAGAVAFSAWAVVYEKYIEPRR
ncbi:hypothetical protein [uncultured Agrococcus sp.]|uniref:hypothetical protein n=1 Tax=uncultured Agrococcus sp. TaxID=382258 RepID=UPI0025DA7465|nr:hypothetical protein [uncultured Agrococcus sp.]